MSEITRITETLGGRRVLRRRIENLAGLIEATQAGLPYGVLDELEKYTGSPIEEFYQHIFSSHRTLIRRRTAGRLDPLESDRAIRIARVVARAIEVLGDEGKARHWLGTPNRALGLVTPLSMLGTDIGTQSVVDVLGRIEHGVFS